MPAELIPSRTRPRSGQWVLVETRPESASCGKRFGFTLDQLPDQVRRAVGDYAWTCYTARTVSARSIATHCRNARYFADYLKLSGVDDLRDLTPQLMDGFRSYLASATSYREGRPLGYRSQYSIFKDIRSIVCWLQVNRPESIAQTALFEGGEYLGINQPTDIAYLSDDVVSQVNAALPNEKNEILRNAILILESTGMRASELENLRVDCVSKHPVNGHMIEWFDLKNGVQRKPIPASPQCVAAVSRITELTEEARREMPEKDRGFLMVFKDPHRSYACKRIRSHLVRAWLKKFAERHEIREQDGSIASLTVHSFRRTLATDMVSKGVDLVVVKEVMGHAFASTTKGYYAKVKDPAMAKAFSGLRPVGARPTDALTVEERAWLAENGDTKALLSDGYCAKPFSDGEVCSRLMRSGQCLTCARFVTTPEFLTEKRFYPVLKRELDLIEEEMSRLKALGREREWQRQYAKRAHLEPLVRDLEEQIDEQ